MGNPINQFYSPMLKRYLLKINFILTQIVLTLRSLFVAFFLSNWLLPFRSNVSRNFKLSKNILVIGNGPSAVLSRNVLEHDVKIDYLTLNYFANQQMFFLLKPRFYLMLDPNHFNLREFEIRENENLLRLIANLNKVTWEMILFLPIGFKNSGVLKMINNNNIVVYFFNNSTIQGFRFFKSVSFKKNLGIPMSKTVSIAAVYLALFMRYENVFILGMEHSWIKGLKVNCDNSISNSLEHFYKTKDSGVARPNKLSEFLYSQASVFAAHEDLHAFSLEISSRIINCTPDSYLDCYSRSTIDLLLEELRS
jgi:hypothetical protein